MPSASPVITFMKNLNNLLSSVSRSFYLSMRFLPPVMRPGVALGYLLARATDTVADTVDMKVKARLHLLKMMGEAIAGQAKERDLIPCLNHLAELGAVQTHRGEGELLCRFGECLRLTKRLPIKELQLIREVADIIVKGQSWDLEYFNEHDAVTEHEQLERYTYLVAGCVGEFWTKLGLLTMADEFSIAPQEQLMEWGRHYGMGLQLVNILRDREEDAERGRRYLPDDDDAIWFKQARDWLKEGELYAETLRCARMRFSTVLPARIGLETLELLELKERLEAKNKVKVPRKRVYGHMWRAFLFSRRHPRQ